MCIGTFNVRGLLEEDKKTQLATDFENYKLDLLCIQETHFGGTSTLNLKDKKVKFLELFYTGPKDHSHNGVGILIEKNKKAFLKEYLIEFVL